MTRLQDWPSRLFALVEERRNVPFKWSENDCCSFARAVIEAMTGEDPGAVFPTYATKEEAEAIISEHGTLEDLIENRCAALGFIEKPVALTQRGDLAIFDNAGNPALGVCIGGEVAIPGKQGLEFHPLAACRRAWRVD